MSIAYVLRPIQPEDMEFLYRVYASTRAAEMAMVDWNEAEKDAFLRQQFHAQHRYYQEYYPGAAFDVIEAQQSAGRLYVARWTAEIRVMDIALLPEARNQGLGSAILHDLTEEGRRTNRPVSIHVERNNPALHFYDRLGFRLAEDKGVYLFLKWNPPIPSVAE